MATLEAVAGRRLFDRGRDGVTLTPAGARLLPRAIRVLEELDAARREAGAPEGPVRLGAFATAAAGLVPQALAALPDVTGDAARGHDARAHALAARRARSTSRCSRRRRRSGRRTPSRRRSS